MKIERIQAFPVRYPTRGRFKFFESPDGKPLGRPAVLVKITADDGTVGWGESVPVQAWSDETLEGATFAIRNYLAPVLIGLDAFDLNGIHLIMNKALAPGFTTGAPITKSGVDMALHDLICKSKGLSLAQYWGRASGGTMTLSWTLNPVSLDDLDALIDEGWNLGYRNFNVKVAPDPAYDLELCRRVKKRVPDGFLWADANGGYELATALRIAPKLADIGVDVLEQPLRPNQIAGYQRMRRQSALPIILDEGVIAPRDLIEWIRLDLLDGVAMKPARCGGLRSARRQVEILEDAGLLFLGSGLTDPDVSLSATLALYAAFGLRFPAALNGPQFLAHSVLKTPLIQTDGAMPVPAGPGLGVDVDETKITEIISEPR
ncbi:MAG: enolase C-terminal domain-like protein [Candidatus Hinthialibacter antarcticus]|nr:enolase C-terminal domain-like protein [Candidatus Hinthialibacter antarcticus]